MKEKMEKEQQESFSFILKLFFVLIAMGIFIGFSVNQAEKNEAILEAKLNAWNIYKNKNCQEVEKLFGMQMGSGKFRYVDDGTVYQCNNGMKYTISNKAAKGDMGMDSIPTVPK